MERRFCTRQAALLASTILWFGALLFSSLDGPVLLAITAAIGIAINQFTERVQMAFPEAHVLK